MKNYKWTPLAIALAMSASLSHATSNPSGDVDIDNDGLIEISTLQELDLMRYDLAGTSLNGDSTGCPATGCNGYELVNDLDFDTNGNGVADEGDDFWNDGEGWESIATVNIANSFKAELNGNGYSISNLFSSRGGLGGGLFGYVADTEIYNLKFENANLVGGNTAVVANYIVNSTVTNIYVQGSITSYRSGAGLAVNTRNSIISDVSVVAIIEDLNEFGGGNYLGGLVAHSMDTLLERVSFEGELISNAVWSSGGIVGMSYRETTVRDASVINSQISGSFSAGGIFGDSYETVTVERALFSGTLNATYNTDPIIGDSYTLRDEFVVSSSYWDVEVSGISHSDFAEGKTSAELQCPTLPGDVTCDASLYADWDETVWDFGTSADYPILR